MDEERFDTSDQLFMRLSLKQHNSKHVKTKKTASKPTNVVVKSSNIIVDRKFVYIYRNEWHLFVDRDDGLGFVRAPGRFCTVIITQQVSRNTYDMFNLWHGHITQAEYHHSTQTLQPCQFAIIGGDEVIVSLLDGFPGDNTVSKDAWKIDAIQAAAGAGKPERIKMEMFSWCTAPIQGIINNKANKQLLNIPSSGVHTKPSKTQLKKAQIGMQLILCELKRDYLVHISGLFVGISFLIEATVERLCAALWADHVECVHNSAAQFKRLPFELVTHIFSFISPLGDNNNTVNNDDSNNLTQFATLLFQNNNTINIHNGLHHTSFTLTNVGSLKNRPHLITYCNKYINQFTQHYNDNECPICFENLNEVSVTLLKCKHSVCSVCWKKVVKRSSVSHLDAKCPLCRSF